MHIAWNCEFHVVIIPQKEEHNFRDDTEAHIGQAGEAERLTDSGKIPDA
jgi:hypothetical protein